VTIDPVTASGAVPSRAQVVIVGGGVIGCSIAYHLAHLGWTDVVLLEQHKLTAGTTWHAAGLITSAGMTDETSLFFSRYSRDLYARLEQETGHSTGFRAVGHISLATTPRRREALRREATWMHGFGVEDVEISARELAGMWPLARTDDVLSAFYVADEGRADPVGVATSLAKGARQLGVRVVEGVAATGVQARRRRVCAVRTEAGRIETETVVNAAGLWARQFGALAGVQVPLQAAEHYYLLTDTVPGLDAGLPVIEDPDNYGYYRPEGDGMLVGLFEPAGAPWSLDRVPPGFSFGQLPPDWERMAAYVGQAMNRIPSLAETGVRTFFCGPESFTSDVRPLLGPASRELIGRLTDAELSNDAFPYLTARQIHVGYAPVLAIRVTYVGELGWELHVPAEYALGVYDDLMAAGRDVGGRLVGLQAMTGLRLEKGYRDMGVDIDNTDTPLEAGLGFAVAWDKPGGFIGRDALLAARAEGPPRSRVVSLLVEDPAVDLFGNEPVLLDGEWVGYVRAAGYGHTVGGPVGLAQVTSSAGVTGQWLKGGGFGVRTPAGDVPARLQIAPFYDPQRLRILDR
jgi:glycine/D-amino acid oxidase-like deaminating enzyme